MSVLRVTGKTLEILDSIIRAFRISIYSVDSKHWIRSLVIHWLHFQCTLKQEHIEFSISEKRIYKNIWEHRYNLILHYTVVGYGQQCWWLRFRYIKSSYKMMVYAHFKQDQLNSEWTVITNNRIQRGKWNPKWDQLQDSRDYYQLFTNLPW